MQRVGGFALIPALFLIVVLAALAAVAVKISAGQSQAVIMGLQQARALAAARSGIEWGAYRALNGACGSTTLSSAMSPSPSLATTSAAIGSTRRMYWL